MKQFKAQIDKKPIGSRIREVRSDMNQTEFAGIIGVSREAISNYERGKRLPNKNVLEKIARYGRTSIDWLLTGESPDKAWKEYYFMFKTHVDDARSAGVIPKTWISDDEMAIVSVLREISKTDRIKIISEILQCHREDPLVAEGYGKKFDRLKNILARGCYSMGFDYESFVEGFQQVLKNKMKGKGEDK